MYPRRESIELTSLFVRHVSIRWDQQAQHEPKVAQNGRLNKDLSLRATCVISNSISQATEPVQPPSQQRCYYHLQLTTMIRIVAAEEGKEVEPDTRFQELYQWVFACLATQMS